MKPLKTALVRTKNLLLHGHYIPVDHYVVDTKAVVYISIPKVACTSVKTALLSDESTKEAGNDGMNIHHDAAEHHTFSLDAVQQKYFKFAFVRNPFDRLVSCYEDKVKKPVQHTGRYYFSTRYNHVLIRTLFGSEFHSEMSFAEFAALVAKIPDWLSDAHFKSQYAMLYHREKKIPDFIGKFEQLSEDWQVVADRIGLAALPLRNRTIRDTWKQYYSTEDIVELVASRYMNDISSFGYQKDYEELRTQCKQP